MKRRSFKLISVAGMVLIAMLVLARAARAQSYTFEELNYPNATATIANGIDDSGDIVGYYVDSSDNEHGFLWNIRIDYPNAVATIDSGVNDSHQIVGHYFDSSGDMHGFLYVYGSNYGTFTEIDDPRGVGKTEMCGINGSGDIVGWYDDSSGKQHGFVFHPTSGISGTFTEIDDPRGVGTTEACGLNDYGDIVGSYEDSNGKPHGFVFYPGSGTSGTFTDIDDPNGVEGTWACGINDNGDIVGRYRDGSGVMHGFVYSGGVYTTIDDPNGVYQSANGINDSGYVVGYYVTSSGSYHGYQAIPQAGLLENATPLGGGWDYLSPFGSFYYAGGAPWIYHQTLGWLYLVGISTDSIWIWDPQWDGTGGWWWTGSSIFPWLYSATEHEWLCYDADARGSQPKAFYRWFWNSSTGWTTH